MNCPKCNTAMRGKGRKDKVERLEADKNGRLVPVKRIIAYTLYRCGKCGYTLTVG